MIIFQGHVDVSVNGLSLGQWISSEMRYGRPTEVPGIFRPEDTETQSRIKALILQMVCPLAEDWVTAQQVCQTITAIADDYGGYKLYDKGVSKLFEV